MAKQKEVIIAELAVRRLRGESLDKIADEIVMISDAMKKLRTTRLTDDTLLLLIQHAMPKVRANSKKMPFKEIQNVLDGISMMADIYIKAGK